MNETFEYIKTFAQFPFALHRFLKHRLTPEEAKRIVHDRMDHREENFLRVVERSIYGYPRSPYLALLKISDCELGDLRALVKSIGLEGALRHLRKEGVYVTFEEFKGRKPIVRNGLTLPVQARDFDNPFARRHFANQSSGSTGIATQVSQDLDHIAETAPYRLLSLSTRGLLNYPYAIWSQSFPGIALQAFLQRTYIGQTECTWFTPVGWRESRYWFKYNLATGYMIFWMRRLGVHVPQPIVTPMDDARLIAHWMREMMEKHHRCVVMASVSRGVRICAAAEEAGIDLSGAVLKVGAEPLTPAKTKIFRRLGVEVMHGYTTAESGSLGASCLKPIDVADIHLYKDGFALIPFPHLVESIGTTVPAFNITAFLATAPKVMLNVQVDDYGIVEERSCGCELESYGFTTHLREIRSYSKLVGEGVTMVGNEMLNVLEQVLPERFGGTAIDYQLMEQEDDQGMTRLYLLIHPRIQIADENAVIQAIYSGLGKSSPMADAARVLWQNAQTIKIKRMEPIASGRGKILPLHIKHNKVKS